MRPPQALLSQNTSLDKFFEYQPIRDRIPKNIRDQILTKLNGFSNSDDFDFNISNWHSWENRGESSYSFDEGLMHEVSTDLWAKN